jgi:hypothetical protein
VICGAKIEKAVKMKRGILFVFCFLATLSKAQDNADDIFEAQFGTSGGDKYYSDVQDLNPGFEATEPYNNSAENDWKQHLSSKPTHGHRQQSEQKEADEVTTVTPVLEFEVTIQDNESDFWSGNELPDPDQDTLSAETDIIYDKLPTSDPFIMSSGALLASDNEITKPADLTTLRPQNESEEDEIYDMSSDDDWLNQPTEKYEDDLNSTIGKPCS